MIPTTLEHVFLTIANNQFFVIITKHKPFRQGKSKKIRLCTQNYYGLLP